MFLKRFFAFADRHLLRRSLPHGMINWRYLFPHPPPKVWIHRRLWLLGKPPRLPLVLYFAIEALLWLRWVTFAGWRHSWRVVRRLGAAVSEREGIGRATQLKRVFSLSLCHCLPPGEIYAFGLYRSGYEREMWDYIFTHEAPAFHRWRSAWLGESRESLDALQDKLRLTELLGARGVPMAPVLGVVSRGEQFDIAAWLQTYPSLFCKPRHGSGSRDAFVIEGQGSGEASIFAVKNGMTAKPSTIVKLQKALTRDDLLVQPFLTNHPVLEALCPTEDAVTLRLITEVDPRKGVRCYCTTVEIPDASDISGNSFIILPVEIVSGQVMRFPEGRLPAPARSRYDAFYTRMGSCVVPFWDKIAESAITAHQCFPDVYAIAWDYVVTPSGPYMLEGNTGWGTATPQKIRGGLLRDENWKEENR
ncbi:MAG: sugar-transfer associated ATP-grasp domain-containing protein [Syntrophales bacterium]|nr:sugar-transfer associated ATP-grasp domain-containing protein [Syntrophales bacterium]